MSDNKQTNEKREMMADIVTELRKESKKVRTVTRPDGYGGYEEITLEGNPYFKNLADRIDAAWKRERAKIEADALEVGGIVEAARTAEKSSAVDNAAAMRDALVQCELFIGNVSRNGHPAFCFGDQCTACNGVDELREMVIRALSSPTRNCDVGTAEEQSERMRLYCKSHGVDESGCFRCEKCPFLTDERCELAWAQMTYEAEEGVRK